LRDGVECGAHLIDADAGLHPREYADARMGVAVAELVCPEADRQEDVARHQEPEAGRHHADDRIAVAAERDGLAYDPGVGRESLLPESVAEHHRARSARAI